MNKPFWTNPPWANGNGHYQMGLSPVADKHWCPRAATAAEQAGKMALLQTHFSTVVQTTQGSEAAQQLLVNAVGKRYPLTEPRLIAALPAADDAHRLLSAALSVPEDFCLLQRSNNDYELVAACVAAPSYWFLPEKIGLNLSGVHSKVANLNATLGERISKFFTGLPANKTFMRRNWFLHANASTFQPQPELRAPVNTADEAMALIVRSETQTLRRLSTQVVVFTIAIDCYPLREICHYPTAAQTLAQALRSRTGAEREAASQSMYEPGVLALLDRVAK